MRYLIAITITTLFLNSFTINLDSNCYVKIQRNLITIYKNRSIIFTKKYKKQLHINDYKESDLIKYLDFNFDNKKDIAIINPFSNIIELYLHANNKYIYNKTLSKLFTKEQDIPNIDKKNKTLIFLWQEEDNEEIKHYKIINNKPKLIYYYKNDTNGTVIKKF